MAATPDSSALDGFKLTKILDQDPKLKSANLLGEFTTTSPDGSSSVEQAILIVEKTHFSDGFYDRLRDPEKYPVRWLDKGKEIPSKRPITDEDVTAAFDLGGRILFSELSDLGQNDIYTWLLAWFNRSGVKTAPKPDADVKMTLIRPATQVHIDKYSAQRKVMVYETSEMYTQKVLPWIESFPVSRIQWVYNILEHKKEADSILYEDPDPKNGFIIVPDLKWDQKTTSSLYIQAIVHNRELRSIRDLTKEHVGMLDKVREQASKVAFEKFGLTGRDESGSEGNVRCFLHYQPSY